MVKGSTLRTHVIVRSTRDSCRRRVWVVCFVNIYGVHTPTDRTRLVRLIPELHLWEKFFSVYILLLGYPYSRLNTKVTITSVHKLQPWWLNVLRTGRTTWHDKLRVSGRVPGSREVPLLMDQTTERRRWRLIERGYDDSTRRWVSTDGNSVSIKDSLHFKLFDVYLLCLVLEYDSTTTKRFNIVASSRN